jgi:hypothetical protein
MSLQRYHWVVVGGLSIISPTKYPQPSNGETLVEMIVGLAAVLTAAALLLMW